MNLKKRNNHKKKIIIGGLIVTSAIGIFGTSFAKYRITDNIKLGNGIINKSSPNLNLIGMYLINKDNTETKIDLVPGAGYVLNEEKTKCTVNNVEIAASIEYKDNKLYFGDITEKGTKCKVYFEHKPKASDTIIAGNNPKPGTNSFTKAATTAADSGLFSTTDDDGTTYYYRGIHESINNWVDFAGFKWRIIRTNGDGSIRMIYNGTSTTTEGTGALANVSYFNNKNGDNAYVGYMYGSAGASTYAATHTNTTSSTIKGILDNWYKTNIVDKNYDKYVSKEAGFCGDRQIATTVWSGYTNQGYGQSFTAYAAVDRMVDANNNAKETQTVTYSCNTNDLYTVAASSKGNKALTYPVGLISADEVIYGGGFYGAQNRQCWLQTGQTYWTMSPFSVYPFGNAALFDMTSSGNLEYRCGSDYNFGVRPVINLSADVQLTGTGTTSDPFKIAS